MLVDLLRNATHGALTDRAIANKVQDVEKSLINARLKSDADPFVLEAEARFRRELNQDTRAFMALKRAYQLNNTIGPIALRLARLYVDKGQSGEAVTTLSETLSRNPSKELRFELAKILSESPELKPGVEVISLLESSFDTDDDLLMPRLYLLREYWRKKREDEYRGDKEVYEIYLCHAHTV